MRELDSVYNALRTDNIGDMTHTGTTSRTKVEHAGTGLDMDVVQATKNTGGKLRTEGVPHAVLDLSRRRFLFTWSLDSNTLLAVDRLARSKVFRNKKVLLAFRNKDTFMAVRLHKYIRATLGAAAATTATTAATTTTATTATGCATSSTAATLLANTTHHERHRAYRRVQGVHRACHHVQEGHHVHHVQLG